MKQNQHKQITVWAVLQALALPIYIPSLFIGVSRGMLIPILPVFAGSLTESYQIIGVILAGEALGTMLSNLPAGIILGRWGLRRTMLTGLAILILSNTSLFFTNLLWAVAIFRIISGIGLGMLNVSRHAYLADQVPLQQRGKAISVFGGIHRAGSFLGPAIGGLLGEYYGLQSPFLLYGVFCLIAFTIFSYALRHPEFGQPSLNLNERRPSFASVFATIRTHYQVLLAAGMGQLLAQTVRSARQTIIPLFANDILGLTVSDIGYIVSAGSAVDTALFFTGGIVMDRWGRKMAIVPSFVMQGIGVIAVAFTSGFVSLLVVSIWLGLANSLSSGTMMSVGADLAAQKERGEFLGAWRLIGDSGFMLGPLVIGGIAGVLALAPAAWAMGGLGIFAGLIFAQFVPETLRKSAEPRP